MSNRLISLYSLAGVAVLGVGSMLSGASVSAPAAPASRPVAPTSRQANPREQTGNHPDGTLAFRVRLDAAGKRNGDYTGYFPGGKKVQERSRYEADQLHGMRTVLDETGKVLADETWFKGKLVFPKSQKLIEATKLQIKAETIDYIRKNPPTVPKGGLTLNSLGEALIKVRTIRYLCDVPYDVGYDNGYIDLCQHGAEVMAMLNELTHTPSKPSGVDDDFYEKAKKGCGSSNIYTGKDIVASVDAYMDDSDKSNIDRLGHRRWILNPHMQSTGFGAGAAKYSAMYSFDSTRKEVPDFDFVSYPPRGYFPAKDFPGHAAWHVTMNPEHYSVDAKQAKLTIYQVDSKLRRATSPMELNYEHVDTGGFGIANAIIARPKAFVPKPGLMYEVVVTGASAKGDKPTEVSYFVAFY